MPRVMTLLTILAALTVAGMTSGCANLMTTRAIQSFADSLAAQDMESLKEQTSPKFEEMALRSAEALDDFKILNLPDGKVSVVSVEEVSDVEKRVTVEVGERKKELLYKLTRQPGSRQWLVDDIYLQQKKSGMDEPITKSVTESMDLLITVREFLDSWQSGGRADVLAITTPELHKLLEGLSPTHLQQLTMQIVGERSTRDTFRPDARIEKERAVVLLPRSGGKLIVELSLDNGRWLVNDVAVESRDEDIEVRSASRMAQILTAGRAFLTSYQTEDMGQLKNHCSEAFYRNSIAVGDPASAPLPSHRLLASRYDVRVHDEHAELILKSEEGTFVLALAEQTADVPSNDVGRYRVDEVTIYEAGSDQVKRLSSMFTSHAMLEIFSQSLAARDLVRLRQSSTTDFNRQAWDQLDQELLASLPLEAIEPDVPHVVATSFQGPMTEVTVTQGSRTLTYILRESRGQMAVDDVLLPFSHRPKSLKENLRALIPVYAMARAIYARDLVAVRKASSKELDRLVWQPLKGIPDVGIDYVRHLTLPVTGLTMTNTRAEVLLGDDSRGTRVTLIEWNDRFVVEDVVFISGSGDGERRELQKIGRLDLADRSAQ